MRGSSTIRQFTRLVLAGGIILAGVLGWVFWTSAIEVETAVARQRRFEEAIREDDQTRVRERYVVAAPLAGTLLRIALKAGNAVRAGDVVASIQPNRAPLLDPRSTGQEDLQSDPLGSVPSLLDSFEISVKLHKLSRLLRAMARRHLLPVFGQ